MSTTRFCRCPDCEREQRKAAELERLDELAGVARKAPAILADRLEAVAAELRNPWGGVADVAMHLDVAAATIRRLAGELDQVRSTLEQALELAVRASR